MERFNETTETRGGPFDTWGAMVFLRAQTFSTPSLNVQFFCRPYE